MHLGKWLLGILVVAIVGVLVANSIYIRNAQARLDAALAPSQSAGLPMTIAALQRPAIPDDQNAALAMRRIHGDLTTLFTKIESAFPEDWLYDSDTDRTPEQISQLSALFADHAALMEALHQAADLPASDQLWNYKLRGEAFPGDVSAAMNGDRKAVRLLVFHADCLRHAGQWEAAARNITTMLKIARHWDHEPTLIMVMLAGSSRGLALVSAGRLLKEKNCPPTVWNPVVETLAQVDEQNFFDWYIASERATLLETIDLEDLSKYVAKSSYRWKSHGWRLDQQAQCAEFYQQYFVAAQTASPGSFRAKIPKNDETVAFIIPGFEGGFSFRCRDLANIRILRAAISIVQQDDGTKDQVVFRDPTPLTPAEAASKTIYLNSA